MNSHRFSGARLRAAREAAGISAERLAIATYPNPHTIEAYEADTAHPSYGSLVRLAAAVGVEPSDLLDPSDVFENGVPA